MPASEFADDAAFRLAVGTLLKQLMVQLDAVDSDGLEARLTEGNLQITFEEDGSVFVLSQQTPTHELWLSANRRAAHFRKVGGTWNERDTAEPLAAFLSRLISDKLQLAVGLRL
jgi:iron donor protein CyaY